MKYKIECIIGRIGKPRVSQGQGLEDLLCVTSAKKSHTISLLFNNICF